MACDTLWEIDPLPLNPPRLTMNYDDWKSTEPWHEGPRRRAARETRQDVCHCGELARMTGMISRRPVCDAHGREETRLHILGQKRGAA